MTKEHTAVVLPVHHLSLVSATLEKTLRLSTLPSFIDREVLGLTPILRPRYSAFSSISGRTRFMEKHPMA